MRVVSHHQDSIWSAAQNNAGFPIHHAELGVMRGRAVSLDISEPRQPRRRALMTVEPAVHQPLALRINRAEDAGENLVGEPLRVHLDPETAWAEARHGHRAQVLSGDADGFRHGFSLS